MSAVIERFLLCDGHLSPDCHESFGVDCRMLQIWQHRHEARGEGWLCRGKKDYCPECRKALQGNDEEKDQ
jgi:hypothetical protein